MLLVGGTSVDNDKKELLENNSPNYCWYTG